MQQVQRYFKNAPLEIFSAAQSLVKDTENKSAI